VTLSETTRFIHKKEHEFETRTAWAKKAQAAMREHHVQSVGGLPDAVIAELEDGFVGSMWDFA
jgi:hypothetical protein